MLKKICQRCQGNGYIKVKQSVENPTEEVLQCPLCNSEGEIIMDKNTFEEERQRHRIKTERLMLESELVKQLNGVIKKLNDEVDMLTKQKIYLQSKLKEKQAIRAAKSFSNEEIWFYSDDFKLICEYADIEPGMVKKRTFEAIERIRKKYAKKDMSKMPGQWLYKGETISRKSSRRNSTMSTL